MAALEAAMGQFGIKSFENDILKVTYVAPTAKTTIDSKALKKDKPDELTCKDCEKWKWCIESSREYPCISFRRKAVKEWQKDNMNTKKVKKHQDSHMD